MISDVSTDSRRLVPVSGGLMPSNVAEPCSRSASEPKRMATITFPLLAVRKNRDPLGGHALGHAFTPDPLEQRIESCVVELERGNARVLSHVTLRSGARV